MDEVFAITLNSMHQDMNRLDRIAMNLANATTPGYKREVVAMRPFLEVMSQAAVQRGEGGNSTPPLASTGIQVMLDSHPGSLRMTGEPFDMALTGDAFFEINTADGPAYTRQGNFRLDARGRLVTAQGLPVMGKNGEIFLTTQTPRIDASGAITEPNATTGPSAGSPNSPIAHLKLVRFEDTKSLSRLGDGLMTGGLGPSLVPEGNAQVRQGALENANVSSLQEMAQLIQTMRHFESIQRITQGYDEMLGTAIRKLGDLS